MNVTKETAILAKELGFNLWVSSYYEDGRLHEDEVWGGFIDRIKNEFNYTDFEEEIAEEIEVILVPIQSKLQKWLRDVHKFWIDIDVEVFKDNTVYYVLNGVHKFFEEPNFNIGQRPEFFEYEEALETGLMQVLKILKNKNNETEI